MFNRKKKRIENLEKELETVKKDRDFWFGEYRVMAERSASYGVLVDKYLFENRNTEIDDEGVIYNRKVYKIVGRKQITDAIGDTLELRCELVDPNKEVKREIGFKVEEGVVEEVEE
mgnify:CR=1 FL=1